MSEGRSRAVSSTMHYVIRDNVGFCKIAQAMATNRSDEIVIKADDGSRHLFTFGHATQALSNYRFGDRVSIGGIRGQVLMTDDTDSGLSANYPHLFGGIGVASVGFGLAISGLFGLPGILLGAAGILYSFVTEGIVISESNSRFVEHYEIGDLMGRHCMPTSPK